MSNQRLSLPQRVTAALALALFCWLNVLAVTPDLHAAAHCDVHATDAAPHEHPPVQTDNHQCAVTLITQGLLELVVPPVIPAAPADFVFLSAPATVPALSSVDLRLAPGRGPPVLPA